MIKGLTFIVTAFLMVSAVALYGQDTYTIDLTVGNVEVSHNGGGDWLPAEVDGTLAESDMVRTAKGAYCEIGLPDDKGSFRVQETSEVRISKIGKETRVKINSGRSVFDLFKPLFKDESFEVETETAIASVRGTQFLVETVNDTGTVSVEDGSVMIRRNVMIDADKELDQELRESMQVVAAKGQEVEFSRADNDKFASQVRKLRANRAELRKYLAGEKMNMQKRARMIKNKQRFAAYFKEHRADLDKIKLRKKTFIKNRVQQLKKKENLQKLKKKLR